MTDHDALPAGTPAAPKPVGPVHLTVLVLFTIGILAIPTVVVVGMLAGFDALGAAIGIGVACLVLSALWSFGRDTTLWVGATMRLARTRGLLKSDALTPFEASEAVDVPDLAEADDEARLDRRRVTRVVADAQRRNPRLKQSRIPD